MRIAQWVVLLLLLGVSIYLMIVPSAREEEKKSHRSSYQRETQQSYYAVEEESVETFDFDPNTADSTSLLRLGLAPWQVRSIYKYRAKHGRYHTPEDFMNVPGMTGELYDRLAPHIRIAEQFQLLRDSPRLSEARAREKKRIEEVKQERKEEYAAAMAEASAYERDTIARPVKYAEGTKVNLNTADTTQLKKIPGIASYRAKKIVQYRQALGGFTHLEQVMEACQMPDEVLDWMELPSQPVKRIQINEASVQKMMRHPYITFYMARDINEYRKKNGAIADEQTLLQLPTFNADIMEKLRDYIEY